MKTLLMMLVLFSVTNVSAADKVRCDETNQMTERSRKFAEISKPNHAITASDVSALKQILIAEGCVRENTAEGISNKYGEGYSEYVSELIDLALKVGQKGNPELFLTVAQSGYCEADTLCASIYIENPHLVFDVINARVKSKDESELYNALRTLEMIVADKWSELTDSEKRAIDVSAKQVRGNKNSSRSLKTAANGLLEAVSAQNLLENRKKDYVP